MPELPEVETSRRGIEPYLAGHKITRVIVRERRLRWPVAKDIERSMAGKTIQSVQRRAKYLLINMVSVTSINKAGDKVTDTLTGSAIVHLGMTGRVFVVDCGMPAGVHDHFDIELDSGKALRFRDPRRFGSLHWSRDPFAHPLLARLGPEPLGDTFNGDYLWRRSRRRRVAVKQFIMNADIVVGVGNIYASESLFMAGINPKRAAGRIALPRYVALADAIREVLSRSIVAGGTTLRDFYGGDGEPGYFSQQLEVYGREGEHCRRCDAVITAITQGQRSTFYCKSCQT